MNRRVKANLQAVNEAMEPYWDRVKAVGVESTFNWYLAWAFSEAATYAIRYYPPIRQWYERKKRRTNAPKALNALACKLAKAVWHVMQGKDFDMKMLFG